MKSARILIIFPLVFLIFLNKVSNGQDDIYFPLDTERAEGENCRRSDGVAGTCRRVENCQRSVRHLRDEDFCSFSGRTAIYCCPNSAPRLGTSEIPITSVEELCEAFYPRQQPHYNILITGGRKSLANQHPYMAAIGWRDFDGEIQWRCGGSVVSRKFVLTAAHCTMVRRARPDIVRTGDLNLRITENNTHPVDHDIIGIYVHPEYRANSVYHDIALLKISPNFGISPTNQPACLWSLNNIPVSELTALGYGTTEYSGPDVEILYEVEIPVLSNQACRIELPPSRSLPFGIIDGQMCALDPNGQKDTCQGDSGGPLQFSNNVGGRRRPTIVGITSFGQYCAGPSPGIYTRVSAYLNWIEPILLSDL